MIQREKKHLLGTWLTVLIVILIAVYSVDYASGASLFRPRQEPPKVEEPTVLPPIVVAPEEPGDEHPPDIRVILNWENTNAPHPERAPWSDYLLQLVDEHYDNLSSPSDWSGFCYKWKTMTKDQKKHAIATMIVAVIYNESGYSPVSRMHETTMGKDPVTGEVVYSEGLLQLSYQDIQWAPWCKFNWDEDKKLSRTSPKKTILDPYINLHCGVRIMANQFNSKGLVFPSKGYWAVMNTSSRYSKVQNIKERVRMYSKACVQ